MSKIFEVGGCVRDELLGVHTNDIDFTFVLDNTSQSIDEGWEQMLTHLKVEGFKIFLETKDCFTVRAKFPKGHKNEGLVADFVMARKEVGVIDGTRKPILELGTLEDDLTRRDFTLNALRFSITKGFTIAPNVWAAIFVSGLIDKLELVVSQERIQGEVTKMMKHDTVRTLRLFAEIDKIEPRLLEIIFKGDMWLLPTTKK